MWNHNHSLVWAMWGRAFILSTVEWEEINDFKGQRSECVPDIHQWSDKCLMHNCVCVSKTHKILICLYNWTGGMYSMADLRPVQELGRLP